MSVATSESSSTIACPLCASANFSVLSCQDGKSKKPLNTALCNSCGLVFVLPLPSDAELEHYYGVAYRQDYKKVYTPKIKHVWRAARNALERLPLLESCIGQGNKVLDIGAGGGEFVTVLMRRGYQSEGVEPNIGYGNFAKDNYGASIHQGMLKNVFPGLSKNYYDVVTAFHVFEHVNTPQTWLKLIHELLSEQGKLILEVPNILSASGAPTNVFFRAHLFHYTPATLQATLAQAGFILQASDTNESDGIIRMCFQKMPAALFEYNKKQEVERVLSTHRKRNWANYTLNYGWHKLKCRFQQLFVEYRLPYKFKNASHLLQEVFSVKASSSHSKLVS